MGVMKMLNSLEIEKEGKRDGAEGESLINESNCPLTTSVRSQLEDEVMEEWGCITRRN